MEVYVYENPTCFSRWSVRIEIDTFQGDKKQIKDDLTSIFAEVLEYFD